jgi:hypothetical protein
MPDAPTTNEPRRRRWLWIALPLVAVAIAVLAGRLLPGDPAPAPTTLPPLLPLVLEPLVPLAPHAALLATQAAAIPGQPEALARLEQEMRGYRRALRPPDNSAVPPDRRWLVVARDNHGKVDALLDQGQAVDAARLVAEIVERAPPPDPPAAKATRRILIQDAYFRIALMALEAGHTLVAGLQAEQGVAQGEAEDLFTANLLIVRAVAHDRLGEEQLASAARQRAARINQTLAERKKNPR